ncbi:PQQ-binding-like beta-propeller repeat protein [Nocardioides sp. YIM 152315]|uniref:outer membrane protein assembly factor BamB family protein n=1 Tax=Nocardioides sp. YIM 152315 TaxID=3031760 RepID=UPI0023DB0760|nr:PQQ-binding-like beta-propeller repeat protein [Nocardioides sp. YIM 152315]MDF1606261.1 PQQ-binding-like beta-propeller repeat protein [Nocardioides sp. YIM 152315]
MTLESPPFCPHCGEPLSPNVGYCPRCGKDVFSEPAPEPVDAPEVIVLDEPAAESVGPEPAPEESRRRRRTALLAVGAVAVVAVGGTGWAMLRGGGDDDGYWSDRLAQPRAVATAPDLAWSWDAGDDVQQVVTSGSRTYVATMGGLTALDADGDAVWTSDLRRGSYVQVPSGEPGYLLTMSFEPVVVVALDAGDGSELWTAPGAAYDVVGDHVVLVDDGVVRVLDAGTGREQWTAESDSGAVTGPDAVYVVADDHLRRLDADTGDVDWSRELAPGSASVGFGGVTVADGFVVAAGTDTARAFDSDTGTVRWTVEVGAPTGGTGPTTGLMTRSTVYVWGAEPGRAAVYDEDGRAGSVPAETEDGFYAFPVHGPDGDHTISGDGTVYDDELERVGTRHPQQFALSGEGVYDVGGRALSFTPFGATEPAWELDLDLGVSDRVTAGDGHVVVASGWTVSDYR